MQRQAFEAGIMPDVFWNLTLHEFCLVLEGYGERFRHTQELLAWHVCYIVNCWSKKKIRPSQILPRKKGVIDVDQFGSVEEFQKFMDKRR